MNKWDLSTLPWLVPGPSNFRDALISKNPQKEQGTLDLYALSQCHLNVSQLIKLGALFQKKHKEEHTLSPFSSFNLGILSTVTVDLLASSLIGASVRYGLCLDTSMGAYDQILQEVLNSSSDFNAKKYDAILLNIDHRSLPLQMISLGDLDQETRLIDESIDYMRHIRGAIAENNGSPVIFQTIPYAAESFFGSYDTLIPGCPKRVIDLFNQKLMRLSQEKNDYLLDIAQLASRVGLDEWHNPRHWNMYKIPYDQTLSPLYIDYVARFLAAIKGKSRKCLVLDLDNTLWGGVIGDDGLEGIVLGQGDPLGESFLDVQRAALKLKERGVILAVCSKNDEKTARSVFQHHPEMILKEEDISVFMANWDAKSTNIQRIAETLNIGIESIVFFDDNPAERAQVRASLPLVAVPELPLDPAYYARILLSSGYFESVHFSEEDKQRTQQYHANSKRDTLKKAIHNIDDYLKSLEMTLSLSHFDAMGLQRIVQLINKSNQFNLTTRRYSETDISAIMDDPHSFTLQARLSDRFGDNGMISTIICKESAHGVWDIDTWLMSCRVMGRSVEKAMLNEIVERGRFFKIKTLRGLYKKTAKNSMVQDHYKNLQFHYETSTGDDTFWTLSLDDYEPYRLPMTISRSITLEDAA